MGTWVAGLAILVLVGWRCHLPVLTGAVFSWPEMVPVTALAFVLLGLATSMSPRARHVRVAALAAVVLLAGVRVVEFVLGWDLRLDEWLAGGPVANTMSPLTVVVLGLMVAAAFLELDGTCHPRTPLLLAPAITFAFFSLLAIGFGLPDFGRDELLPMAVLTSLLFLALGWAAMVAHPERESMRVLLSPSTVGRTVRLLLGTAVVAPLGLQGVGLAVEQAGWVHPPFALALATLGTVVIAQGAILWSGVRLERLTLALQAANADLETKVQERTRGLNAANVALRKAEQYKDEWLAIISHELRTPLNFIMGFGSILEEEIEGPLNPRQHEVLASVMNGTDRMLALVNNLLDMSRLAAGKFEIHPAPTAIAGLVGEVVTSMQPLADRHGLQLTSEVAVPGELVLDGPRLIQVLLNLVGNAIKFTAAGGAVAIRASIRDGALRIEVADTGIGIAPEELGRLFVPFNQIDSSATRATGGTGLGLAISRSIVEAHGGQIGVQSVPGAGSVFWFTLPITCSEAPSGGRPRAAG